MYGDAHTSCCRPAPITLHNRLEDGDVGAVEDRVGRVAERRPAVAHVRVQVTLDAAGVVLERIRRADGAHVDREVGERARGQAAAPSAGFGTPNRRAVALNKLAVPSERVLAAVKHGRFVHRAHAATV